MGLSCSTEHSAIAKTEKKEWSLKFVKKEQSSAFLTGLLKSFEQGDVNKAMETVQLLGTVYQYDKDWIFSGDMGITFSCYFARWDNMAFHQKYIKQFPQYLGDQYGPRRILVEGTKPYLLAFAYSLFDMKWLNVFKELIKYSVPNPKTDMICGISFYDLAFRCLKDQKYTFKGIYLERNIFRNLFKNIPIDNENIIQKHITESNCDLLEDILDVCDCKDVLEKRNFLFDIARTKDQTYLIPMFMKKGQSIFERVGDDYCFNMAIRLSNSTDFLYYLKNYDILILLGKNILYDMCQYKMALYCFVEIIDKANKSKIDLINGCDTDKKVLPFLCNNYKTYSADTETLIGLLVLNGGDIYEMSNGKRLVDTLLINDFARLVNRMVKWKEEYAKSIPAPPPVVMN